MRFFSVVSLPIGIGLAVQGYLGSDRADVSPNMATAFQATSYTADIAPIFEARCVQCHGGVDETGKVKTENGLNLSTYEGLMTGSEDGPVIEPGDPDTSVLIDMIVQGDMPEEGDLVPPQEIEMIRAWITEGAKNDTKP